MAVTVGDTVNLAFRKLGVVRAGGEAKAADAADALSALVSFYMECVTGGAFGRVWSVPVSTAGTIEATGNQHINVVTEDTVTVDLPSTVPAHYWDTWMPCRDYGWGLNVPLGADPNVRMPRDKAVVMITDQVGTGRATYVYDAPVQRWMRIDALVLTDEAPLSARNADGLASVLATRIADQFGDSQLSRITLMSANRYRLALVNSYGSADDDCGGW